jgi:hypothetical protein
MAGTSSNDEGFIGLVIVAVVAIVVFMGYPLFSEGTGNSCLALEKRELGGVAAIDDGRAAEQTARKYLPDIPSPIACTYMYWKSLF